MIAAGELRHIVQVERYQKTGTGAGGQSEYRYVPDQPRRARIRQLSTEQLTLARAKYTDASHEIKMRYVAGVSVQDRIRFKGRTFYINEIDNVEELDKELLIVASEQVG